MQLRSYLGGCAMLTLAMAVSSLAGVVATNAGVPWPQLVSPEGTDSDPTIFLYDGYTHQMAAIDIGTYYPHIQLKLINQSNITVSPGITFLGGDYPNMPGESGDYNAYPGHQSLIVDNSTLTTAQFRIGSKNSYNTMFIRNGGTMNVNGVFYLDQWVGTNHNAVNVTTGSTLNLSSTMYLGYGGTNTGTYAGSSSNESLTITGGSTVNIGTPASPQGLYMRYTHDSFIRVSGELSKLYVTDRLTLGSHSTYCYGNKLIIENDGEVWIRNSTNPISSPYNTSEEMNKVQLADGSLVISGNQTANSAIANLIWVWDGTQYVDGTLGSGAGRYSATYYTTGEYAGYTVFTGGTPIPEPGAMALLSLGGLAMLRRRH